MTNHYSREVQRVASLYLLTTECKCLFYLRQQGHSCTIPSNPGDGTPLGQPALRGGTAPCFMTVVWLVTGFVMALTPPIFGLYVTDRFGVGYAGLGAISTTAALGAALGQLVGGQVADRVGHSRLMVFSLYLTVPSWPLITLAGSPIVFSILNVVTYVAAYVAGRVGEAK